MLIDGSGGVKCRELYHRGQLFRRQRLIRELPQCQGRIVSLTSVIQIGSYGPNCTAAEETPHPPTALLLEPRSTDNLRISVPVPEDKIASAHPDTRAFVNGTANGLICFNPPRPDQNLWPYGGQGLNASPTGSNGNTPTPSSDTPEPSSTGAGSRDNVPLATNILGLAGSLLVMITKCLL